MLSSILELYRSNPIYKQFAKFVLLGVLSAAFETGMLILMVEKAGIDYLVANLIAFAIVVVINYFVSRMWVFGAGSYSRGVEFLSFLLVVVVGFGINQSVLWFLVEQFALDYRLAKIPAIGCVVIWNFIAKKYFVFKRRSVVQPSPDTQPE